MLTIDNGTTAPGQNSSEFGATIAMADQTGPFDFHLTRKLVELCQENQIPYQKDVFRYYRSDSASALEAGHDIRTALVTFGVDASHGYERIHKHALTSVARLVAAFAVSPVKIRRDAREMSGRRASRICLFVVRQRPEREKAGRRRTTRPASAAIPPVKDYRA